MLFSMVSKRFMRRDTWQDGRESLQRLLEESGQELEMKSAEARRLEVRPRAHRDDLDDYV